MSESVEEKLIRYEREAETMPDAIKPVVKRLLRGIRDSLAEGRDGAYRFA